MTGNCDVFTPVGNLADELAELSTKLTSGAGSCSCGKYAVVRTYPPVTVGTRIRPLGGSRPRYVDRSRRWAPSIYTKGYPPGMSKIMVSLPEELVQEIDKVARQRSMSRSALLAAAARREIARPNPSDIDDAIIRSEERFRTAGRLEAADLVRRDRETRR